MSTIKVSKPSINLREALSDLKQDTGLKGQELMRADTVAEARTAIGAGRKNLIINGGFDVWQRGISFTGSSYWADRWTGSFAATITRTAFAYDQTDVPNSPTYYADINFASGGNSWNISHRVEGVKQFSGKTVTLSFWSKSSTHAGQEIGLLFRQNFGSGGSAVQDASTSFILQSNWSRHSVTVTLPVISSGTTIGAGDCLWVNPNSSIFSPPVDLQFQMTNVQLELGSVATEFEHRSYGEELALCQRYYRRYIRTGSDVNYSVYMGIAQAMSSTSAVIVIPLSHPMRDDPSFSYNEVGALTVNNGSGHIATGLSGDSSKQTLGVNITASGLTLNQAARVYLNPDDWIAFDAEL